MRLSRSSQDAQTATAEDITQISRAADAPDATFAPVFFARTAAVNAAAETLSPAVKYIVDVE